MGRGLVIVVVVVDVRRVSVGGCLGGLHPGSTDLCLQGIIGTIHILVDIFKIRMHPVPFAAAVGGGDAGGGSYLVVRHERWWC